MPLPVSFWAREDSGSAANPALNLTGASAVELTFVAETNTGGDGDLFLDTNSGGVDPDTQVEIGGVSYEFIFELSGTMPTKNSDGAQQVPDQFETEVVYIITVQDYPTAGDTTRYAFMPNAGATAADMDDFGNGAIDVQGVNEDPPAAPICFLEGTMIAVSSGQVPVESLSVGDMVMTGSGKSMPIIWIGQSLHEWPDAHENGKPILISEGALGDGLPTSDLGVSPQHKMVLKDPKTSETCLVPAKSLIDWPGIREMKGKKTAVYFQQDTVFGLVPSLRDDPQNGYGPFACKVLSVGEARQRFGTADAQTGTNVA